MQMRWIESCISFDYLTINSRLLLKLVQWQSRSLCLELDKREENNEPRHVISNNVAFWQVQTQASLCSPVLSLETPSAQCVA